MSVAIPTVTRLQDQHDVNVTLGAGVDEYALTWDNGTARFVLRATTGYDHGLLNGTSLADDDHTQYALLAGRAGGQTLYGGTDANDDITIHGTSNATRATSYVILQPTAGSVGIGATIANVYGSRLLVANTAAYPLNAFVLATTDLAEGTTGTYFAFGLGAATGNTYASIRAITGGGGSAAAHLVLQATSGNVGIGTTAPATLLHAVSTTATTNALRNVLTLGANVTSTGVGAAGLGAAVLFQAESTTTADQDMAQIGALWTTATHATRASALTFSTLTAGGSLTERVRIDGAGKVGIGAVTPLQKLHVAGDAVFDGSSASPSQLYLTGSTTTLKRLMIGYDTTSDFGFIQSVYSGSDNTFLLLNPSGGSVGIGTTVPGTLIHGLLTSAATNTVTNVLTIGHDTSGTAAAGFGAGLLFRVESSTTAASPAARIRALWYEATHATRKGDLVLTAYDTAEREGLRIRGDGSAPAIGFLGATPQARIAHVADPAGGATVDAEARTAINSILSTLELFGFHAVA
jgi:hypothetical protein